MGTKGTIVVDIYYFFYKLLWKKFGLRRGQGILLDLLLLIVGDSEYSIAVEDSRLFRGDLKNIRYRALFWNRVHEPLETQVFKNLVRAGEVVFDVGANIGWYTTLAGKLVDDGKVYAFEPIDVVASELRKNIGLNHLDNVAVQQIALSDRSGFGCIWFSEENWGLSSLTQRNSQKPIRRCIELKTLDHWVRENSIETVTLIKCDIEGAEILFLRGATETVKHFQPIILLELNTPALHNFGFEPSDLLEILHECGYDTYAITSDVRKTLVLERLCTKTTSIKEINVLAAPRHNRRLYNRCLGVIESQKIYSRSRRCG